MMVCSCNCITDREIIATVDRLMLDEPLRLITPAVVYKALGKRPRCGGCMPNTNEMVQARVDYLRGDGVLYTAEDEARHTGPHNDAEAGHGETAHLAR